MLMHKKQGSYIKNFIILLSVRAGQYLSTFLVLKYFSCT